MEETNDNQWQDPLLLTDVPYSISPEKATYHTSATLPPSLNNSTAMEDRDLCSYAERGDNLLEFSSTCPDLVVCGGIPDVPCTSFVDSPEILESKYQPRVEPSVELSLDDGIKGSSSGTKLDHQSCSVRFSTAYQTFGPVSSPESSFELLPPAVIDDKEISLEKPEVVPVEKGGEVAGMDPAKDDGDDCNYEVELTQLIRDYKSQKKELFETRKALEELKRENQLKNKECQETCKALHELQNELMRKSMHVGSLAFAIEGQVKEKSKWFSSLRDLTRKLKIMKMEQIKLSEDALAYKKCLDDMNVTGSTIQSTMDKQAQSHKELKDKFVEGAKKQKELYNKVLELKGNIRVFCRCRPLNAEEISAGAMVAIDFDSSNEGELTIKTNGVFKRTFKFDAVFGPQADQAEVFQDTAPFAASVLDGYNVCIFAYGQTGTGKTYTMEGIEEARGVNYRTLEELFRIIKERQHLHRYELSVSVMEVYNEQIRDLLAPGPHPGGIVKRLEVRQASEGVHHIPGLIEAEVSNMNEVWDVLQTGSNARVVGSTSANEHSSRSHCIHCVKVKGENLLNGECIRSKLWLVDLAGSERIAKTEVQGERLKETQNINRSLSALGDVISALATRSPHIPFRNSKLTHLLQDSLGGDSKALMFVQISPNENDLSETICSLNFASRVKGVELGPAKRQLDTSEFIKYKQMAEKAKHDLKSKDVQIKKMEETIQSLDFKVKDRDVKNRSLQEKVKELESQLLVERKLARQHVDMKLAEQQQMTQQEEQNTVQTRLPLASRQLGSIKEVPTSPSDQGQANVTRTLVDNNSYKPSLGFSSNGVSKYIDFAEKENNPIMLEQPLIPKRTGRASICTVAQRVLRVPEPRRNSLIPLPAMPNAVPSAALLLPLQPCIPDGDEPVDTCESECLPEKISSDSPKGLKSGSKRPNSALRRSLQKKMAKSPLPQHVRKYGVNVGMEKVRVSIGNRGRIVHRVVTGNSRLARTKELQQKQSQKEKERRWNIGTVGRIAV